MIREVGAVVLVLTVVASSSLFAAEIDLSKAVIVVRSGQRPAAEKIAPTILMEEVARRSGVKWTVMSDWPKQASAIIAISTLVDPPSWQDQIATTLLAVPKKPESFAIRVLPATGRQPATVILPGVDSRGAMFGVGKLLRNLDWKQNEVSIADH